MFISTDYLGIHYGVDDKIARFFVDREPPTDNLYWEGKLLYLRPSPGYLFIPLIVDLLFKVGINKEQLLSEEFISVMEKIGHYSSMEEAKQITGKEAFAMCAELVKGTCKNEVWYQELFDFISHSNKNFITDLATPYKALHRGDVFLFSTCALSFSDEFKEKILKQWFALITTLLLQDDGDDVESDLATGEENAFIECSKNGGTLNDISNLVKSNVATIAAYNKTMANQLERQYKIIMQKPSILQLLKQS